MLRDDFSERINRVIRGFAVQTYRKGMEISGLDSSGSSYARKAGSGEYSKFPGSTKCEKFETT